MDDIKNEHILYHYIYTNKDLNYYISEEFSKEFYIELAAKGFISTSIEFEDRLYLLPEIQFEYALLDFENLHIGKKVKKLLTKNNYELTINKRFDEVLEALEKYHSPNWVRGEYKTLMKELQNYTHPNFKIISVELCDKESKKLIAGELGYKIGSTYTSLTGFSSKQKEFRDYGKLQLVIWAKYLKANNYSFWNLGHPQMEYKKDLGAKIYSRNDFLRRWLKEVQKA